MPAFISSTRPGRLSFSLDLPLLLRAIYACSLTMTSARYLPLSVSHTQAQAPGARWWRRRAMQVSFFFLVSISSFALFEYAAHLIGDSDISDLDDDPGEPLDTSLDAAYLPFNPNRSSSQSKTLKPSNELPASCLDAHIAHGALCYSSADSRMDILWTWVNGSDLLLTDAKARVESSFADDSPYRPTSSWKKERQFRSVIISVLGVQVPMLTQLSATTMNCAFRCAPFWKTLDSLLDNSISSPPTSGYPRHSPE